MKTCASCKETLPLSSFHRAKRNHDGRHSYCKGCRSVMRKAKNYSYTPEKLRTCPRCKKRKPMSFFARDKSSTFGCHTYCRKCYAIYDNQKYRKTLESFLLYTWRWARRRAKTRNLEFTLEPSSIEQLWKAQKGICALSGRPLTWGEESDILGDTDNLSLDRIDSSQGYIPDNIHLVTARVNLMKRDYSMANFVSICQDVSRYALKK